MNTKKIILPVIIFCLLTIIFAPVITTAAQAEKGIVTCGNSGGKACTIDDFFTMLGKIYSFLVLQIATPLAVLAVIIGGVLILISAGNPNLAGLGKKILYSAIIGLILAFCSYLIIDTILKAVGFPGGLGSIKVD